MHLTKPLKSRVLPVTVFLLSFLVAQRGSNLYAPLTEGWWHVYVRWLAEGRTPYRDFEFLLPPGYLFVIRLVIWVVGDRVEVLRFFGGAQIGLIGLLLHVTLKRISGGYTSAVIALVTVIYIRSGPVFVSYDYHYVSMVLFLTVVWGILELEKADTGRRYSNKAWIGIGLVSGFSLSIKQSQGFWTFATVVTALLVFNWNHPKLFIRKFSWVALGITASWTPILIWFQLQGVTSVELLRQLSLPDRPKGPMREMFFGWIHDVLLYDQQPFGARRAIASLSRLVQFVMWLPFLSMILMRFEKHPRLMERDSVRVSLLTLATFIAGLWLSNGNNRPFSDALLTIWNQFLQIAPIGSLILVLLLFSLCQLSINSRNNFKGDLFLVISAIAIVWACGMSAGITEIGAYYPVAVSLAFFVRLANRNRVAVSLVVVLFFAAVSGSWQYRMNQGFYAWWGYKTPTPQEASEVFDSGILKGLHTSPEIKREYSRIQEYLAKSSTCDGEVIVFPHLAAVLVDANLTPSGRLGTLWYDFSSQGSVKSETSRIAASSVRAIVILELSESVLQLHETMFNENREMAHRKLLEVLIGKTHSMNHVISIRIDSSSVLNAWFSDCAVLADSKSHN